MNIGMVAKKKEHGDFDLKRVKVMCHFYLYKWQAFDSKRHIEGACN